MLPEDRRLRASTDFTEVVRRGRRASRPLVTVHALQPPAPLSEGRSPADPPSGPLPSGTRTAVAVPPARAGLVVSKAVGGSVVRHRTARRLRHLLRDRLGGLPAGTRLVVRASPAAGSAPSTALATDLDGALTSALRPRGPR